MAQLPAVSLAAVPGRRAKMIEVAQELERKGFPGIYGPSLGDSLSLCNAIALSTKTIEIGTSITPIYTRNIVDFAQTAGLLHEISEGRFRFGVGVSHAPAMNRMGITQGKPLADMKQFVEDLKSVPRVGDMPPIILATLRKKMIQLAEAIGDGMVFANGARSHMADSLSVLKSESRAADNFFIGNMIPTCISDDKDAAAAVNRKTLTSYAFLPNYRNYWKAAGYQEEMESIELAIKAKDYALIPNLMSDKWLSDVTLYGSAGEVKEGLSKWYESGLKTPILVPSSPQGGQFQAFQELFGLFAL